MAWTQEGSLTLDGGHAREQVVFLNIRLLTRAVP